MASLREVFGGCNRFSRTWTAGHEDTVQRSPCGRVSSDQWLDVRVIGRVSKGLIVTEAGLDSMGLVGQLPRTLTDCFACSYRRDTSLSTSMCLRSPCQDTFRDHFRRALSVRSETHTDPFGTPLRRAVGPNNWEGSWIYCQHQKSNQCISL